MPRISTPCIRVCLLDPETGLCEGCGRTTREIAEWGALGEEARLAIMAGLDARMRAAFAETGPGQPDASTPSSPARGP